MRAMSLRLRLWIVECQACIVVAGRCLFVGDGSGGELTGATKVGMTAVLMRAPYDQADGARKG